MKVKYCKWCDQQFDATVSYQIYCSVPCREEATREKISERYIAKRRERWTKKPRFCRSCSSRLSVYNDDNLCDKCLIDPEEVKSALKDIKGIIKDET